MRQRHIKDLDTRLLAHRSQIIQDPEARKGNWRRVFLDTAFPESARLSEEDVLKRPLYLEVGCGKGQFITRLSALQPENLYVAIEGHQSVGYFALKKTFDEQRENVRFVLQYVHDAREFFLPGEVDGLYLNFSDPWPKARHEKRRLTSPRMLGEFGKVVKPGGFIEFKTDNEELFRYSVEQFQQQKGMRVDFISDDLHSDVLEENIVTTEYEDKFSAQGVKIHFIRVIIL